MHVRGPSAYLAGILAAVAIRFAILDLPSSLVADVYYYNAEAVSYLMRGIDPYGAVYAVPAYLATAGASTVFAYLPGVFAFVAPAAALWVPGAGLVLCDMVIASSFYFLVKKRRGLHSLVYLLFPPTFLFSTFLPNDALPAMAFLSVGVLFESKGRTKAAAPFWGAALAASQEAWLAFPFYAFYCIRGGRYKEVLISLASAAVLVLPFLAWNPTAFTYDTVLFQFARQATPLISTGPFGLNVNPSLQGILLFLGTSAPLEARVAFTVAAFILALGLFKNTLSSLLLASTAFTAAALFLLAGQLFWSYLELPFVTLIAWVAIRGAEVQTTMAATPTPTEENRE